MKNKILLFGLICVSIGANSQFIDTIYFDLNGKIFIKELAAYYRIAEFDTTNGLLLGSFKDYNKTNDSLISSGVVTYSNGEPAIKGYVGDSTFFPVAKNMLNLKASYIRIRDYPALRAFIHPHQTMEERTRMTTEYGDFIIVEVEASFIEGFEALDWFLNQLFIYPEDAGENDVTGVVRVEFAIDIDGSVTDVKIIERVGYGIDEEVIRVMNLIPDWLPAIQHGRFVKMKFTLPIPIG